jgi:hypothetical protein
MRKPSLGEQEKEKERAVRRATEQWERQIPLMCALSQMYPDAVSHTMHPVCMCPPRFYLMYPPMYT